jgi:acylphosphatase
MTTPALQALAAQINSSTQRAIRDQRTYVETLAEQATRDGHVHGFIKLPADGEIVVTVHFPIAFMEKPIFTNGLEMDNNTWISQGSFPIYSATVVAWTTQKPSDATLWMGASLGIVTIGAMRSILHYSFEGRTFTSPIGTELSIGSPL